MKSFEYGDGEIGHTEIFYAVASMVIAIGILNLPRDLAQATNYVDGVFSLIIAGLFAILFTWMIASLAAKYPKQSFYSYTASLISRPIAFVITLGLTIHFLLFVAYETRMIGVIAAHYIFDRTPIEVASFSFLMLIVYAVSGSHVGILRLNLMFLPIIVLIAITICLMNLAYFDTENLSPFFTTDLKGYWKGVQESYFSFSGYEILLFYIVLMNRPKKAPKFAALGMIIPVLLYATFYVITIGVFSYDTTQTMVFPTIELAKEVEVPGGFFERLESVFFIIWIMAIFNTAAMAYDVSLLAARSIFKKVKKKTLIFIFSPIIFLAAMFPQNLNEIRTMATYISYSSLFVVVFIPIVLLVIAKLRGIKGSE
ncbi:GerAB/ArcD/ProY family transporter [Aquibacillus albus]|uniref:Spore germination protein n=1 Tax=Aquibacillus albus TaxID=1168171 RepID=A0ABS2MYS1_9BACI|nr:endospore germination permease [Aquibacillus albus]MBM7571032.1 spore germination protein [Aquibacillus albus]